MFSSRCVLAWCAALSCASAADKALTLTSPTDYQVIQRSSKDHGTIVVQGALLNGMDALEARLILDTTQYEWTKIAFTPQGTEFRAELEAPAGAWYHLEVRALHGTATISLARIDHVGVGEVFVVAGQSNSANHGEEKQSTKSGLVSAFDIQKGWRLAQDPEPGATGKGGSFMPPLGDALAKEFNVPVGFVPCGIGATSVREWLPRGVPFPNPPTPVSRVHELPNGSWESDGKAFQTLVNRLKGLGPHGCRAVLWHQGESDAHQKDPKRTLAGSDYRQLLEKLIQESRKEAGWEAPWFVAQASYHVPGDEGSQDIRDAQASVCGDGFALLGPDTDQLKSEFRERNGKGVHFTGPGLREHARLWAKKLIPWTSASLTPHP